METRFFKRDAFLIDEASFQEVMQEIMDDESLFIEYGYLVLSLYSHKFGYCVEEDEIMAKIGEHLHRNIVAICWHQHSCIWFVATPNGGDGK